MHTCSHTHIHTHTHTQTQTFPSFFWSSIKWVNSYQHQGWDQAKAWILKGATSHSKCITPPLLLPPETIWTLKSSYSRESPTHAALLCRNTIALVQWNTSLHRDTSSRTAKLLWPPPPKKKTKKPTLPQQRSCMVATVFHSYMLHYCNTSMETYGWRLYNNRYMYIYHDQTGVQIWRLLFFSSLIKTSDWWCYSMDSPWSLASTVAWKAVRTSAEMAASGENSTAILIAGRKQISMTNAKSLGIAIMWMQREEYTQKVHWLFILCFWWCQNIINFLSGENSTAILIAGTWRKQISVTNANSWVLP